MVRLKLPGRHRAMVSTLWCRRLLGGRREMLPVGDGTGGPANNGNVAVLEEDGVVGVFGASGAEELVDLLHGAGGRGQEGGGVSACSMMQHHSSGRTMPKYIHVAAHATTYQFGDNLVVFVHDESGAAHVLTQSRHNEIVTTQRCASRRLSVTRQSAFGIHHGLLQVALVIDPA